MYNTIRRQWNYFKSFQGNLQIPAWPLPLSSSLHFPSHLAGPWIKAEASLQHCKAECLHCITSEPRSSGPPRPSHLQSLPRSHARKEWPGALRVRIPTLGLGFTFCNLGCRTLKTYDDRIVNFPPRGNTSDCWESIRTKSELSLRKHFKQSATCIREHWHDTKAWCQTGSLGLTAAVPLSESEQLFTPRQRILHEPIKHWDHSKVTQRRDRPRASSIQHCITLRQLTHTDTRSTWTFEILSRMGIQQQPKLWWLLSSLPTFETWSRELTSILLWIPSYYLGTFLVSKEFHTTFINQWSRV